MRSLSDKSKGLVVGKVMEEMFSEKGVSMRGGAFQIQSSGRPRTVTFGQSTENNSDPTFSFHSLSSLHPTTGFSDNQTLEVAKYIRYEGGKKQVESNLK